MTEVMSTTSSPSASPAPASLSPNPNHPPLPPLVTSPPARRSNLQRPLSHASKNRLSQYSITSDRPSRSRPPSHIFPAFHSSLPYTTVRDFAYGIHHPLHYGPLPEPSNPPSGTSTPASESKRFSDPPTSWDSRGSWEIGSHAGTGLAKGGELPPIHFGDGPPWSEDEDLQSPIVISSRHKKHKTSNHSHGSGRGRGRSREEGVERNPNLLSPDNFGQDRSFYAGSNGDGSERYYVSNGSEANGPGGEIVTVPAGQAWSGSLAPTENTGSRRDSHFAGSLLPSRTYADNNEGQQNPTYQSDSDVSSRSSSPSRARDESRYSRDYQFTIASPDEEMHGKAVALFDFERENENELPLVEGQIIWVSYRHGQGWLVAEDPKTRESGLVPEEYVRLLRDIQGGLSSLTGQVDGMFSPGGADSGTPTQAEHGQGFSQTPTATNGNGSAGNGYQQPIVSTFSTSSKDLHPYPQHLLGTTQAGMAPPQVVHYHGQRGGSQANTPTLANSLEGGLGRRDSEPAVSTTTKTAKPKEKKAVEEPQGSPMDEDASDDE
ncbi:hypothetical protein VE02_01351 [Pseudogymnoascus sp. 03VT05]|nr:hypothetical protein VE02_01351 [Pseudogymnoascus sp. 03VT05]